MMLNMRGLPKNAIDGGQTAVGVAVELVAAVVVVDEVTTEDLKVVNENHALSLQSEGEPILNYNAVTLARATDKCSWSSQMQIRRSVRLHS